MLYTSMPSPLGELLLAGDGQALRLLHMQDGRKRTQVPPGWREDAAPFAEAQAQLGQYFAGERTDFDLPLALDGTPFQQRVWSALCEIPYGETVSYGELAARIGSPGAARAVGLANGSNPIAVIVPCHRVIGANGALTGFGGGMANKRMLLDLETDTTSGRLSLPFAI
jgi:methylated-DNA-[protein]-cysteine S-methyltransferase